MNDSASQTWSFTNSRGSVITTHNATDAEKYRHHPAFTEVTDPEEQLGPADPVDPPTASADVSAYADESEWTKRKLNDEIEARNDAAGDDEPPIEIPAHANRQQLVDALTADDAARAATDNPDA